MREAKALFRLSSSLSVKAHALELRIAAARGRILTFQAEKEVLSRRLNSDLMLPVRSSSLRRMSAIAQAIARLEKEIRLFEQELVSIVLQRDIFTDRGNLLVSSELRASIEQDALDLAVGAYLRASRKDGVVN